MRFFDNFQQTRLFWTLVCSAMIFAISVGSIEKADTIVMKTFIGLLVVCSGLILGINLYYLNRDLPMKTQGVNPKEVSG